MTDTVPVLNFKTAVEWCTWLAKNHAGVPRVRHIIRTKNSGANGLDYNNAIDAALCYGWIDSVAGKAEGSMHLTFTPRKPKSNWSKVNRERAETLIANGLMMPQGQKMVNLAKDTGTCDALADADNLVLPPDLQALFDKNPEAKSNFEAFAPLAKKHILGWIIMAKHPETRLKRIEQTVAMAQKNIKANQPG